MIKRLRPKLTYANVMATIAVFVALGGSSYAALRIGSDDIVNNSVRGKDVRNRTLTHRDVGRNALGGTNIRESRLQRVPRARIGGSLSPLALLPRVRCPAGTTLAAGVCFETSARRPSAYSTRRQLDCGAVNHGNRRLSQRMPNSARTSRNGGPTPSGGRRTHSERL